MSTEGHEQLIKLSEFSLALAEARLDMNTILNTVSYQLAEHFQEGCVVRLFTSDKTQLNTISFHHVKPEGLEVMKQIFPFAREMIDPESTQKLIKTGEPVEAYFTVEEVRKKLRPEFLPAYERLPIRRWLMVSLRVAGELKGIITMIRDRHEIPYTQSDRLFIQEIAHRSALAIDNAMLYTQATQAIQLREDFMSIASHELRTPLTSLKLQIQLLARYLNDSQPEAKKTCLNADQQIERLAGLIEMMLDSTRASLDKISFAFSNVPLKPLLLATIARFQSTIELHCPEGIFGNWASARIEQVFENLISNGIKYGLGKPIEIRVHGESDQVKISFIDRGIGIPPEDQIRIFERFERAPNAKNYGGMGLGLYISKKIVEAHEGKITVESQSQLGSTFTVCLPLGARSG